MHQVQWPQHAIKSRENAQVLLGKAQLFPAQGIRFQARVNVPLEGQYCLRGVVQGKRGGPVHEPLVIQVGDVLADAHEGAYVCRAQLPRILHQDLGARQQLWLGCPPGCRRGVEVERLGR